MRTLSLVLAATLAVAVPSLAASPAGAAPPKPKAELVTKAVTGELASGQLSVSARLKNKGNRKAGPSTTTFRLSPDATASSNDAVVGTVATGKIKAKASRKVAGTFPLPSGVAPGSYRVIACADSAMVVKERKDANNCKASNALVTIGPTTTPPPTGPGPDPVTPQVTVSWSVSPLQTVLVGSVSGLATHGVCQTDPLTGGGTCVVDAGVGTVTLTATSLLPLPRFSGWTGAGCVSEANPLVLVAPATNVACTANFNRVL